LNKKAALELGISTIVILVIAMVVIAGAITFIRGFFNQGTTELTKVFDINDFSLQPTSEKPVIFAEGDSFSLKRNNKVTIKIGLYNKMSADRTFTVTFNQCTSIGTGYSQGNTPVPKISVLQQTISPGEGRVFNAIVEGKDATDTPLDAGTYICSLQASSTQGETLGFADATIEITS